MRLRFLGKNSVPGDSLTLYATDRSSYLVQGWKVTDREVLAKLDLPADEMCVEVPAALFVHLAQDGLRGAIAHWAPPIVHVTGEGTYVVQGKRVTDAEARDADEHPGVRGLRGGHQKLHQSTPIGRGRSWS